MSGLSAHPPQPRAPPACKRCSVNKKKCDRMVPRCTGCVLADAPCEPVIKASDKRLMRQMEEMREEAAALKRQVAELQQEMQRRDATGPSSTVSVPSQPSGSSLPALPLLFMTSNEHPVMSPKTRHLGPLHYIFTAFNLEDVDCSDGVDHPNLQPWTTIHDPSSRSTHNELLPTVDEVLRTIQSLAEASKHGPSNLDKIISLSQLQEDCRVVYGPDGLQDPQYAGSRFRCFVTVHLAMSMTAAANAEDITVDPCALACLTTGFKELPSVTEKADFTCVESLTLLSELSIHARIGLNLWQLLGAATRTAAAINLHRRDDVYLPTVFGLAYSESQNSAEIAAHNQRRRDLFWALYSLDRLAAFILNRPPSLADADIDVDLPPATMWPEGKYATLSSEALWTHHIQSRRLYGQIQNALDARARNSNDDGEMSAQEVINGYMQQVQQWYMKSRFNSTVIPFTEESVKRHVLDDIQYHQMVISLHQPSGLVPDISSTSLATLYRSATLSVGLFHHAASRKQLNIHWVNLHQAFTSCATLIYCVRQHQVRADLKAPPEEKVAAIMAQCREVISLFGGVGPSVQQYKTLLAILIEAFQAQRPSPATPSDISRDSLAENSPAVINQLSPSSGMDFAMGMTFNPEMFPGIAEGAFLDGPSNILSPTYWMDNGQVGPERGVESTSSGGSRAERTSISSGAHNT